MEKKCRLRRSFTSEFKAEAVELCRREAARLAQDFDLTGTAVCARVRQAKTAIGRRDRLTSGECEELAMLRLEKRRLREDVDILKW
ncbi:hypothetical protein AB0M44_34485 [Streptosporangium subroseum]|uniref:hypothetical protein n=1 Tax=Streptosporangium subroseum TaxID=106412 RepID=UPI0034257028